MRKQYEINAVKYEQRPLVLGQWRQLLAVIEGLEIPAGDVQQVLAALAASQRLEQAAAVVLIPTGQQPREKDNAAIAAELEWSATVEDLAQVVADFFTCNLAPSNLERLTGIIDQVTMQIRQAATGSKRAASTFAVETSPGVMPSCGESLLPLPDPGCDTERGS
ncbi:MAG: hypothetical protein IH614_06270 [Desulfuromonadales bacterium]|nr:hypothetical protein [Desulfuromonadales bacterium]